MLLCEQWEEILLPKCGYELKECPLERVGTGRNVTLINELISAAIISRAPALCHASGAAVKGVDKFTILLAPAVKLERQTEIDTKQLIAPDRI